MLIMHH